MTDAKDVSEARRIIERWREESPHLIQPEHWIPPIIALLDSFDTLIRERDALTMHMNQVHATLGGTDTVLTLEAAQHVVFERDEAVDRGLELQAQLMTMLVQRDEARKERDAWELSSTNWQADCRVAQSQISTARVCKWREDDPDFGTWRTGCGHLWSFNAGGPEENDAKFCQYCGGALTVALTPGDA